MTKTITSASGNRYHLVVPVNDLREGSYGKSGAGAERPVGSDVCGFLQQIASCP